MLLPSFIIFLLLRPCPSRWQRPYNPGRNTASENPETVKRIVNLQEMNQVPPWKPASLIDIWIHLALCAKCSWKVVYKINICIWKSYTHSAFLCDFRNVFPHTRKKNICPNISQNDAEAKHGLGRAVRLPTPLMQEVHQTDNRSIWSVILLQKHGYVTIHNQFPLKYLSSLPELGCSGFNNGSKRKYLRGSC